MFVSFYDETLEWNKTLYCYVGFFSRNISQEGHFITGQFFGFVLVDSSNKLIITIIEQGEN